ncbi:MAG: hypothetical protein U0U67_11920 [Chitinophagales bacterium]
MKTNNFIQSTKSFFVLLLAMIAITLVSCKKESDDPNITYRSINKTIEVNTIPGGKVDSIDFDGNGVSDFYFFIARESSDTFAVQFEGHNAAFNLDLTTLINSYYVVNEPSGGNTPVFVISDGNYNVEGVISYKFGSTEKGIAGKGDKIIAFGYGSGPSEVHYGWMRMNLSADYKTFKIIDCGFSTLLNTPIGLGIK